MTTTYYNSYQVKKSNGVCQWFASKDFDSKAEAVADYEARIKRTNVVTCHLFQKDHYEQSELRPRFTTRYPEGADSFSIVKSYIRI